MRNIDLYISLYFYTNYCIFFFFFLVSKDISLYILLINYLISFLLFKTSISFAGKFQAVKLNFHLKISVQRI